MDLVECLGVEGRLETEGRLEMAPGWGVSVELIGSVISLTYVAPINCCWFGHTRHWCNRQH